MTRAYHSPPPRFDLDALERALPAQSFAKLQRLAVLDDRYVPQLLLLEIAALALEEIAEAAAALPLREHEDIPVFVLNGIDQAALRIGFLLRTLWPDVEARGKLLSLLEENDYHLGNDYLARTTRIMQAGRTSLLQRIMVRVARDWMNKPR